MEVAKSVKVTYHGPKVGLQAKQKRGGIYNFLRGKDTDVPEELAIELCERRPKEFSTADAGLAATLRKRQAVRDKEAEAAKAATAGPDLQASSPEGGK
jgi:hypothetical protein